ncbi:calcium-binding protein [Acuticoccus sp. MNP-M23]|uniref:beta strand repeat-containing protein n=1 Tax=Acuticoccus sp. MNP-M23 TaxID=3072793 RepID=UPI0028158A73|nr:calcium-binding protein [Acuticoccus sp. MNP-M23]WMS41940.1 calcium-binding protein [Acuticoccus sp. MNP-M23]
MADINGNNNANVLNGTDENDLIDGNGGNDSLSGLGGNDGILGDGGNDTLDGGAGNDTLIGGDGNDLFIGSEGADFIFGDRDFDTVDYSTSTAGVNVVLEGSGTGGFAEGDTYRGVDGVIGSDFADTVTGHSGRNVIETGDGDDTVIDSDNNSDTIDLGAGNDTLVTDNGSGDTYEGGTGTDTLRFEGASTLDLLNDTVTGFEVIELVGDGGDVRLRIDAADLAGVTTIRSLAPGNTRIEIFNAGNFDLSQITLEGIDTSAADEIFVFGTNGADTIILSDQDDTLDANSGDDRVFGGAGDDSIFGDNGNDTIDGGAGNDTLRGANGNDTFIGSEGADVLDGGGGRDTVDYSASSEGVNVNLESNVAGSGGLAEGDTYSGVDDIIGSIHDDTLNGHNGNNFIDAGGGFDTILDDAEGSDTVDGGSGNDTFIVTRMGRDVFDGGSGNFDTLRLVDNDLDLLDDTITNIEVIELVGSGNGGDMVLRVDAADLADVNIIRSLTSGNVRIQVFNAGPDFDFSRIALEGINTSAGDEIFVSGTNGADTIVLSDQDDTLDANGGDDRVFGGAGDDSILGDKGNDTIDGGAGNDTLRGADGNDTFIGSKGADVIDGGRGRDTIDYSASTEGVKIDLGSNNAGSGGLAEGDTYAGVDDIIGSDRDDTLSGNNGNNFIDAGGGFDTILDDADGADTVDGGSGNDTFIVTRMGRDVFDGGSGNFDTLRLVDNDLDLLDDTITNIEVIELVGSGNGGDITLRVDAADLADVNVIRSLTSGNVRIEIRNAGPDFDLSRIALEGIDTGTGDTITVFGSNGADRITLSDQDDTLDANGGDDRVFGGAGDDSILGDNGNDTIDGGAGNDTLIGHDGNDTFIGSEGADILNGGRNRDTVDYSTSNAGVNVRLQGNFVGSGGFAEGDTYAGIDDIIGSAFNDTVGGNDATNNIAAGDGDDLIVADQLTRDTVDGGAGTDTLRVTDNDIDLLDDTVTGIEVVEFLGTGNVTLRADGADLASLTQLNAIDANRVTVDIRNARDVDLSGVTFGGIDTDAGDTISIHGTSGADTVTGSEQDEVIDDNNSGVDDDLFRGLGGDDTMFGDAGNDTLDGGDGNDVIRAGSGDDFIIGGAGADDIRGESGIDTLSYSASDDGIAVNLEFGFFSGGDAAGDEVTGIENIVGTAKDDILEGDDFRNDLFGGGGRDQISGGGGWDELFGGDDIDFLHGDAGNDVLDGGNGNDRLFGGEGADQIFGGNGVDMIEGDEGNDTIDGGSGNDRINGGDGNDVIDGGANNDRINGGNGFDDISGGNGKDQINAGDGADSIDGGAGHDTIEGGDGDDRLTGGDGRDTFVFSDEDFGDDLILDFKANETIDLQGVFSVESFDELDINVVPTAGNLSDVTIEFSEGTIELQGINFTLDEGNFIF